MTYPAILTELETMRLVAGGSSLARYGDGEFNICRGGDSKCQPYVPTLQARLREILHASGDCLVGIPNLRSDTPKAAFWSRYGACADLLIERCYASAFVSRPDSAPWIDTAEYWALLESLWVGQDVTIVRGGRHGLTSADLGGASSVRLVIAPAQRAWTDYSALLEQIGTPRRALLCLGPTATVLAVDLCARGVHAIDVGHVGLFLRKHRRGEPLVVTAEDKAA